MIVRYCVNESSDDQHVMLTGTHVMSLHPRGHHMVEEQVTLGDVDWMIPHSTRLG